MDTQSQARVLQEHISATVDAYDDDDELAKIRERRLAVLKKAYVK